MPPLHAASAWTSLSVSQVFTGDVFENADRRVDLAVERGEQLVPGDLNLDQRPDEIVKFVGVALFVLVVLVFVFVGHRTQFLPV